MVRMPLSVDSLFWSKRAAVSGHVSNNLRQIFCIGHDIYVAEHLEISKVLRDPLLPQRSYEGVVSI